MTDILAIIILGLTCFGLGGLFFTRRKRHNRDSQ